MADENGARMFLVMTTVGAGADWLMTAHTLDEAESERDRWLESQDDGASAWIQPVVGFRTKNT